MKLKNGASLKGVQWQMFEAAIEVEAVYNELKHECVITAGTDGEHMPRSLHYKGLALDFRTHHVPNVQKPKLVRLIKQRLGPDFDVVLETHPPHLHLEYDP